MNQRYNYGLIKIQYVNLKFRNDEKVQNTGLV